MDSDEFVPGVPNEVMLAGLALRFELLRVATLYGLRDAVLRARPESSVMWHAWMNWLSLLVPGSDEAGGSESVPDEAADFASGLLEGQDLLAAIDGSISEKRLFSPHDYDWKEALENIEEAARRTERFLKLVPLGEGKAHRTGVDLHGAVQDSLVLLVYGHEQDWRAGADSTEIYRLLRAARAERMWSRFDPNPSTVLPASPERPDEGLVGRDYLDVASLANQLIETSKFYSALHLAGDVLSEHERCDVIKHLRAGVFRLRAVADFDPGAAVPTPDGHPSINLRTVMSRLRKLHRSLILALSDQSLRRDMVITTEEFLDSPRLD